MAWKSILLATDASPACRAALDLAATVAREHSARLTIAHAVDARTASAGSSEWRERLEEVLQGLLATAKDHGVAASTRYDVGRNWEVVLNAAREVQADLIVVGAEGRSRARSVLLGSTADRIIRAAPVPVLTVPGRPRRWGSGDRTVVAAVDFSPESQAAVDAAVTLLPPAPEPTRLVLIHAWRPLVEYSFGEATAAAAVDDTTERQARAEIEELAGPYRDRGFEVEQIVRQGFAPELITHEAEVFEADLIAMGTHGRSGVQHLMLGSVAERVLHHAPCPVLTVRRSTAGGE